MAVVQITLLCVRSQSIGKLLLRLRIVGVQDEQPGGPVRAFLMRAISADPDRIHPAARADVLGGGFLLYLRADRRCIHDLMAGTKVVRR
ncbi:MAG: RDD family protein [Lacunisphaera sp.]